MIKDLPENGIEHTCNCTRRKLKALLFAVCHSPELNTSKTGYPERAAHPPFLLVNAGSYDVISPARRRGIAA